jgi:RHS repeat-associated protein
VKTSTGIWAISHDTENRPTDFTSMAADSTITTVHCEYDYMGRRAIKRDMVNGNVTLQQRYIYRGYLQIACIDLTRSHHPALWYITWDPTQNIATRPLALQKDGTWYTYGWDLTKNICEVYRTSGTLGTSYTYTPYGQVSAEGATEQPIQWSSEFNDTELGLIYYNYRHYNPVDGRWTGRDRIKVHNEYIYVDNISLNSTDILGEQRISQLMKTCTRISEERKTAIRNSKHFRGCDINIACEYTRNAVSYANVNGYNITLYIPRCMSDGEIGLLNTLNHELIHLYDNCKLGGIRDCRSFWYGEIRASYFGQCAQIVAESKRKACAIRGAKRSVSYIVKKKLKDKAKDAAFWQPCYPNDKVADKFAENAYIQMKRLPNNPFATL